MPSNELCVLQLSRSFGDYHWQSKVLWYVCNSVIDIYVLSHLSNGCNNVGHLGDTENEQRDGITFPLDPVFSEAVKTSFSFVHESLLDVEKHHFDSQPHSKQKVEPSDIEFGSFFTKFKCEESYYVTISAFQSKSQMLKV